MTRFNFFSNSRRPEAFRRHLRDHVLYDVPVHVSQTIVPALGKVRELFVIDPHQVQDRGLQVVHVNGDRSTKTSRTFPRAGTTFD